MNKRIDVKPPWHPVVSEITARTGAVFGRYNVRADMKRVIDPADSKWKRAAAVGERDTQSWEAFEDAAKNHRTDRERRLCRHGNQPGQPVFRHTIAAEHVPGMNKNRGLQFFGGVPNRLKRCIIEVQSIHASEIRIRVHVRPNLRTAKAEFADAAFQFACCQIGILHWNSSEASETRRMIAHDFGN